MSDPISEKEKPFANRVSTVAREILGDIDYDFASSHRRQLDNLAHHVNFLKTDRPYLTRQQRAEGIVHNHDVIPFHRVIAYAMLRTELFQRWSETQKRYLLDRALGEEILWHRSHIDQHQTMQRYFSSGGSSAWVESGEESIAELEGFQAKLRQPGTSSGSRERR